MWTIEQAFIEIDGLRKKITDAAKSLSNYVLKSAIKNNLTTTAAGNVLDARQGKILGDQISNLIMPIGTQQQIISWTCGTLTTGAKEIRIDIPTNKITYGRTITAFNVKAVDVRNNGNYLINGHPTDGYVTNYVFDTSITSTGLHLIIKKIDNTAFDATNNIIVSVYINADVTFA